MKATTAIAAPAGGPTTSTLPSGAGNLPRAASCRRAASGAAVIARAGAAN